MVKKYKKSVRWKFSHLGTFKEIPEGLSLILEPYPFSLPDTSHMKNLKLPVKSGKRIQIQYSKVNNRPVELIKLYQYNQERTSGSPVMQHRAVLVYVWWSIYNLKGHQREMVFCLLVPIRMRQRDLQLFWFGRKFAIFSECA
jgi:hypothetical protein